MNLPEAEDPITKAARALDPPRYTVRDAAALVGRSRDTLIRWRRQGYCYPTSGMQWGSLTIALYTEDDIERLKHLAATLTAGRKPNDHDNKEMDTRAHTTEVLSPEGQAEAPNRKNRKPARRKPARTG